MQRTNRSNPCLIGAHCRGGSILPMQLDAFNGTANTTAVVKASPLSLLLVLPDPVQSGNATAPVQVTGMVYNDDGSTVHVSVLSRLCSA